MQKTQVTILLVFLFLSVVIFLLRDSAVISPAISFFQSAITNVRAPLFSSSTAEENNLAEENRRLTEKLSQMEIVERENIALKSQFQDANYGKFELIPVKIVGFKGRGVFDLFMINAGTNQKIEDGMAVILGNTLVGTIHKAGQNISEVRTTLHPEFSTLVKYPPTNARGIIRGFNSYMILDNVPVTDSLEKGGVIVTLGEISNSNIGIPSDINVGKIDSIEKVDTATFQTAQIESLIDYSQISDVFVILGLK